MNISNTILTALKISFFIALAGIFMVALNTFLNLLVSVVFSNVVGEVLSIISVVLPFDASSVFGSIITAISAIGGFMVGVKIYELTSARINL